MSGQQGSEWLDQAEELGARSLVKLVLAVNGLLLLLVLVSVLPGVDRVIPGVPVTIAAIINAVVTLAIVLLLLEVAAKAKAIVRQFEFSVSNIGTHSAAVVYWTVVFLAVVIAYDGFGAAIEPVMLQVGFLWAYDLAFFLLGSASLLVIGYHLFQLLDPLAEYFVVQLRSEPVSDPDTIQTTLPIGPVSEEDEPGSR